MSVNQRRFLRRTFATEFSARDGAGAGQLMFLSADLSAGGAFLKSDLLLEQGETLSLEFTVEGRLIRAPARVAWVRRFPQASEPAGMGVEFLAMKQEDRQALLAALALE